MVIKLFILFFLVSSTLSQSYNLMCSFEFVEDLCTCRLLIFNPNGSNDLTIGGNPIENCTFDNTIQVISTGESRNVPSIICDRFPLLEILKMERLKINTLEPNPFLNCRMLKTLNLGINNITEIIPFIFMNTRLESLDVHSNNLTALNSNAFFNLGRLKALSLENNPGIILPERVFDPLVSLESLNLRDCNLLDKNAGWFGQLTRLTDLYLSINSFTTIPSTAFRNLTNLVNLDMSVGKISSIATNSFAYNRNLRTLRLNNNNLTSISANIFDNLINLEVLSLSMNNFTSVPSNIFKHTTSLRKLSCSACNIQFIVTEWFETLRNLDSIDLSCNHIRHIPVNTFKHVNQLMFLYINSNKILNLNSRSFGSLTSLYTLDARDNSIYEIDHYFMNQSTILRNVFMSDNDCTQLDMINFMDNKMSAMEQMTGCFDNFDNIMIELETYNSTQFDWHNIRPNDEWEAIRVSIKAAENVHIGLTDSLDEKEQEQEPLIEIHIGERDNRDSSIYERGVRVLLDNEHRRLNVNEMRTFIIGWKFGIVMVYEEAERFPFMAHFIRQPFPVNFFGLRTQINPLNSRDKAIWNVSRIQGNELLPMYSFFKSLEA
ncbi:leucine-rich repeat-containing protein 15-like [Chironomus tepperi]|uniref:leucine-rich repeat-containing protein 15-like n=1 Tax=Chironomus tepperi TaxID=113505 RepID=UPI00391F9D5A